MMRGYENFIPDTPGIPEIVTDGRAISRHVVYSNNSAFIVRILRKVGYSWQHTGLDVTVNLRERTVRNEYGRLIAKW